MSSRRQLKGAISYGAIVGQLLKHYREARGIKQAEVAKALGLTQSAYSRLENGDSAMSLTQLRQIARVIEVNPEGILAKAETHAQNLVQRGVKVTEEKPTNTAAILIGLGILLALLAAIR